MKILQKYNAMIRDTSTKQTGRVIGGVYSVRNNGGGYLYIRGGAVITLTVVDRKKKQ